MSTGSNYKAKICLLFPGASPGSYMTIATALARRSFKVPIIALGQKQSSDGQQIEGITIKRLSNEGIFHSPFVSLLNPLLTLAFVRSAMGEKAGVYWGSGYSMLPVLLTLKIFRKRVIYDVSDDTPSNYSYVIKSKFHLGFLARLSEAWFRAFEYFVIQRVDHVITLTESLKRDREKHARKITAIYYCVDSAFNPTNIDEAFHNKYKGRDVIVYSGTIALQKGLKEALASFKLVRKEFPDVMLLLAGGVFRYDEREINQAIRNGQDVIVTGWLPYTEMPKYITIGKVGLAIVNPINYSYKISVPFKLIEQMACGLPVIAPKGFPEVERIVKGANCGFLVDVNKPDEIARAVIKLLKDEPLRQELSRNGIKYIKEHHNLERFEAETVDMFQSVLEKP